MNTSFTRIRRAFLLTSCAFALGGTAGGATAQAYPSKPLRFVVPFPAGGGTDLVARTVAQRLTDTLKWTIIVENRTGAGGNLGVDAVAKSPADGYTMVIGQTNNLAISPALYPKLPYNSLQDLEPVVLIGSSPIVIATSMSSPYKSWADVVAASRKKAKTVSVGYSGNGTVAHLSSLAAEKAAGIELQRIPYKGASQAMTDLISGQIDLYMSSVPGLIGQVRNQKLRVLAVTSDKRSSELPDVPTLAEAGVKNFNAVTWFGIFVPAHTPATVISLLNAEFNKVLKDPAVVAKLRSEGGDVAGGTPEQLAALLKDEMLRWGRIVKESGAVID